MLTAKQGKVYIVGAGPGDPGLITIKGIRCIEEAEVIIFDHLVSEELLRYAKTDVRLIYAGKQGGDHTLSQDEINHRLVEEASRGRIVTRLKGGDPFIFGRGGEEALMLSAAGIPFDIVPGVTSAIAVPAYAGISLTQRGYTSTLAFVTGHEDPTKERSAINWQALAGIGTLVFLMGVKNLSQIAESLIENGKPAETPAALIRWGTTTQQKTLTATLGTIAGQAEAAGFSPPSILVVGDVVAIREQLNWFETKPLFGKGIVITRPEAQAESLSDLLLDMGARAIHFPTIRIVAPESWTDCDNALAQLQTYQWMIFTSANGVRFFFERLQASGHDIRDLKDIRFCTIGPATAEAIKKMGLRVDLIPREYISEGIVQAFENVNLQGAKVLLPRAEQARDVIPEGLTRLGAQVDVVTVYRTINSGREKKELEPLLNSGEVDVITFTSPSTVANFMEIMGKDFVLPQTVKIAVIGPVTAAAAEKAGMPIHILQETYTIPGLVAAMKEFFKKENT
ncbi:MAG: uroporphyrinogen III methyltransferase / synthase [Syntrophus sp. SKADARSKE-3]|nr:uroporphyrinogen III methyltransferase / synthase [Syntrophus sp. SKADARSKE-3]